MTSPDEIVIHMDGLVVGPNEWLVLSPRGPLTNAEMQRFADQVPEALHGRVLVVDEMDLAAVPARRGRHER